MTVTAVPGVGTACRGVAVGRGRGVEVVTAGARSGAGDWVGSCTRMAVGCPPLSGVATGVSVSVVSAVAVGEVAGTCAGPDCSVSHAAAAMSRRVARIRIRIGDTSRSRHSVGLIQMRSERSIQSRRNFARRYGGRCSRPDPANHR